MAGQIDVYRQEILNFLRTVTIKFEPFAYLMGNDYMEKHGLDNPHGEWNPYYINLSGQYSPTDTPMTVRALETDTQVPFDRDLFTLYPRTAKLYRIPNQEYFTLQERYPEQRGLIQNIVYPVASIKEAIEAPNLSLLSYDASLLEQPEREDIIKYLKDFLTEVRTRWWVDEFVYEDMYATTFWCMLWQLLPTVLLTRRFSNIRTPYVHSFHVWEYLKNHGIGDYRDVFTTKQALWLYRNLGYVLKNQGKNSTLKILAENLLPDVAVSLLYKEMWQETDTRVKTDLLSNPQFRSFNLLTGEWSKTESFSALNERLVEIGLEHKSGADYIDETEIALATQPNNILPTKFLEFRKNPIDSSYEQFMYNFMLDSIVYRAWTGRSGYGCTFKIPTSGEVLKLDPQDLILLMHYAAFRSVNQEPVLLPTEYMLQYPFVHSVADAEINPTLVWEGNHYDIKEFVDVEFVQNAIEWLDTNDYENATENARNLVHQFKALLYFRKRNECSNSWLRHRAMYQLLDGMRFIGLIHFDWSRGAANFEQWIDTISGLRSCINEYDAQGEKERIESYQDLVSRCFYALCPLDNLDGEDAVFSPTAMEKVYIAVRNLFISLGSYNVTYLETDRDKYWYVKVPDPDYVLFTRAIHNLGYLLWLYDIYPKVTMKSSLNLALKDLRHDVTVVPDGTQWHRDQNIEEDLHYVADHHWSNKLYLPEKFDIEERKRAVNLNLQINITI